MAHLVPDHLALVRPMAQAPRKGKAVLVEMAHDSTGGSGGEKGGKDLPNAELYLQMGIEHNTLIGGIAKSTGQP